MSALPSPTLQYVAQVSYRHEPYSLYGRGSYHGRRIVQIADLPNHNCSDVGTWSHPSAGDADGIAQVMLGQMPNKLTDRQLLINVLVEVFGIPAADIRALRFGKGRKGQWFVEVTRDKLALLLERSKTLQWSFDGTCVVDLASAEGRYPCSFGHEQLAKGMVKAPMVVEESTAAA